MLEQNKTTAENQESVIEQTQVNDKPQVKFDLNTVKKAETDLRNKGGFKKDFNPLKRNAQPRVGASGMQEKVVAIKRISKTTKGGRHMRFSALVVIGDKKGKVGFGLGKSGEVPDAIKKAIKNARNNVFKVVMNKRGTVYHEITGNHGAGRVLIKPAPEGTGLIAGGAIRAVIELAGYKDIYTKNLGKNTTLNMIHATINGLLSQMTPAQIAKLRDKELSQL